MTASAIQQFRDALQGRSIIPPDNLITDGNIHRCDADGKGGKNDAAYLLHTDGVPAGGFENHRDGLGWETWRADIGRKLTPAEEAEQRARIETAKRAREAEEAKRKEAAREKACLIWADASACTGHDYLTRKGVSASGARLINADKARQVASDLSPELSGDLLVIPMRDTEGVTHSLQFITTGGTKRPVTGGRKAGCYFGIGKPDGVLCIAEGFATGASIHEATGHAVAIAFDAGNLYAVAKALHDKYHALPLVICADDDIGTANNPGLTKAREAAQAVGGRVAVPDFGSDRPDGATDFNDLHQLSGLEAVKRCIEMAINGEVVPVADAPAQAARPQSKQSALDEGLSDDERLSLLAELSPIEYDKAREEVAKLMGVRASTLDKQVASLKKSEKDTELAAFPEIEPWHEPVDLAALLTEVSGTIQRFIICNEETAHAAALWVAMSWSIDTIQVCPLAVITAPEKRCGKSQLLFLLGKMVRRPLTASNISPAALFRSIDAWQPTLLVDEADAFMRDNEELRGILNAGHTRDSAYIVRVVGDDHTPKMFNVWGAKAIAGIGHLADTLMDRSIILELRRKMPHENVERLRHAEPGLFDDLAAKFARSADDYSEAVRKSRPNLPSTLNDRAQDNWEPLLAIAEVAGGDWPALAKQAALKLSGTNESGSVGNELLADIQEIIQGKGLTRISTADLIHELCADEEKPWATYNRGRQIAPRQVASKLKSYGILSATIKFGSIAAKGYRAEQFDEAFARYLSSPPDLSVYPLQPNTEAGYMATDKNTVTVTSDLSVTSDEQAAADGHAHKVTDNPLRYGCENLSVTMKPAPSKESYGVTDRNGKPAESENVEIDL